MTKLPPLDELLGRIHKEDRAAEMHPNKKSNETQRILISLDCEATERILDINESAHVYEVVFLGGKGGFYDLFNEIVAPTVRNIYRENPGSTLIFCYESCGYETPSAVAKFLPDITRKIVLDVNFLRDYSRKLIESA